MREAGLNPSGYGFHSFRSGFLSAALSVGEAKGESIHDVLTRTALITGWKPLGIIQFNYVKDHTRQTLITTNTVGMTDVSSTSQAPSFTPPASLSAPDSRGQYPLQNTEDFHHITVGPREKRQRSYAFEVKHVLYPLLKIEGESKVDNDAYVTTCYNWCLRQLARRRIQKDINRGIDEMLEFNSLRLMGAHIVDERLEKDCECAPVIAREMKEMLIRGKKLKTKLNRMATRRTEPFVLKGPTREMLVNDEGVERRKRLEWADEEEAIFQEGIEQRKSLREIASKLYIRMPDDVRLHLRWLNNKRAQMNPPQPPIKLPRSRAPRIPKIKPNKSPDSGAEQIDPNMPPDPTRTPPPPTRTRSHLHILDDDDSS